MNLKVSHPKAQIATFLWLGFVLSISFMESWIKFQAPGISLAQGLGIGQLVFGALNFMEWVFALFIAITIFLKKEKILGNYVLLYFLAATLLFLQSVWLLPMLDERATAIIKGETLPQSYLHIIYVVFEIVKVIALAWFGLKLYKRTL